MKPFFNRKRTVATAVFSWYAGPSSRCNLQNPSFLIQNSSFLLQNSSFLIQNSSFVLQNSSSFLTPRAPRRSAPARCPRCQFHIKWPLFSAKTLQNAPVLGEQVAKKRPFNVKYAVASATQVSIAPHAWACKIHHFKCKIPPFFTQLLVFIHNSSFLIQNSSCCLTSVFSSSDWATSFLVIKSSRRSSFAV